MERRKPVMDQPIPRDEPSHSEKIASKWQRTRAKTRYYASKNFDIERTCDAINREFRKDKRFKQYELEDFTRGGRLYNDYEDGRDELAIVILETCIDRGQNLQLILQRADPKLMRDVAKQIQEEQTQKIQVSINYDEQLSKLAHDKFKDKPSQTVH